MCLYAPARKKSDKSAVAVLKGARQVGCVFQELEPPKFSSILRKSTRVSEQIRCVKFSKAALLHANIRESKGPSLGIICPANPHERSPYAPKFEDRSQEETERQEQCARGDASRLVKSILMLKEKDKATFLSLAEAWCLPAPSVTKPDER